MVYAAYLISDGVRKWIPEPKNVSEKNEGITDFCKFPLTISSWRRLQVHSPITTLT